MAKKTVFLREATGLVRSWSWMDVIFFQILALPVGLWTVLEIPVNEGAFPGANQPLGAILCTIFLIPQTLVYAMLSSSMPRAGGDYIFQSRILNSFLSYVTIGTFAVGICWFYVFVGPAITSIGIVPALAGLAVATHNSFYLSSAQWFASTAGGATMGIILLIWGWFVIALGLKFYGKVQRYVFITAIGTFVIVIALLFATTQSTFINNFNTFVTALGGPTNAYQSVLTTAQKNGFPSNPSFDMRGTIYASVAWTSVIAYTGYYTGLGGEIKRANSLGGQLKMSMPGFIIPGLLITVLLIAVDNMVGNHFDGAASSLFSSGQFPVFVGPYVGLFLMAAVPSIAVALLVLIFFNAWTWMNIVNTFPWDSRVSMAMAFDRMLPERMASVNERFHSPITNITVWVGITGVMFVVYYTYPSSAQLFLLTSLLSSVMFSFTCLAGAILPFRGRASDIYAQSGFAKYKVGSVPVITIAGILGILFWIFADYVLLTVPALGVAGVNVTFSLSFLFALAAIFVVLYFWYRYSNAKKGIDMSVLFKTIPPE